MRCKTAINELSALLDGFLDENRSAEIRAHLDGCAACRRERDRLAILCGKLGALEQVESPDYLRHLLGMRLASLQRDTWHARVRSALEYRWFRIRSTERIWYLARLAGTAATFALFFFVNSEAMRPVYFDMHSRRSEQSGASQMLRQQLSMSVLKSLGLTPLEAQKRPISPSDPMINDLYLLNFGQSASHTARNDSFSVVTVIDRSGAATIQDVLEYPADTSLLADFSSMLQSARCRPASQNGKAVESHLVLSFSRVSVFD
jgi:hypothetical protein